MITHPVQQLSQCQIGVPFTQMDHLEAMYFETAWIFLCEGIDCCLSPAKGISELEGTVQEQQVAT